MKRTFFFSLVVFLTVTGFSKAEVGSNVNQNENQSAAVPGDKITTAHNWTLETVFPLVCSLNETGGWNVTDYLEGTFKVHCVMQYQNQVLLFMNMTYRGTFTGIITGEVFRYSEEDTYDLSKGGNNTFHFSAVGNLGTHLVVSGTYLDVEPWVAIDKAICK